MTASHCYPSAQRLGAAVIAWFVALATAQMAQAQSAAAEQLPASTAEGTLVVNLTGMKSDDGRLVYAMWSGPEGWLENNNIREGAVPIIDGASELRFEHLPYGEYAISAYHDRNNNGKLDTGMFRIPKEALGTSNDAKVRFGPPKYEDAVFYLAEPELIIHIPVRKLFER